jgi:hypothetical protein
MKPRGSIHNKRSQITCWLQWKLHLNYFEKSPIIIYNDLFVLILGFCLFIHEIDILKIWNDFIMVLESFKCHTQNTCWYGSFKDYKIWTCFLLFKRSPNVLNFIMGSNILHKKGHMCLYFPMHMYWILWTNVVSFNFEHL